MSCLLGLLDTEITKKHSITSFTSKVGGNPNWFPKEELRLPSCKLCQHQQSLIVQLYCPLGNSNYHRTLYIFACTRPPCWNKSESWTVYRCQHLDQSVHEQVKETNPPDPNLCDWGTDANDWGVESACDWGVEYACDWGMDAESGNGLGALDSEGIKGRKGAGNWGEVASDFSETGNSDETKAPVSETASTCISKAVINRIGKEDQVTENSGLESVLESDRLKDISKGDPDDMKVDDMKDENVLEMQQMCIEDVDDSGNDETENMSHIQAEEKMTNMTEEECLEALRTLQTDNSNDTPSQPLCSYFVNVFEEEANCEDSDHVSKLLREYENKEGSSLKEMMLACSSGSSGGSGEKYEKDSLLHKDKLFHKFMKRLTACPEQIIRYEWSGHPLFIQELLSSLPTACCHCKGLLVFELQLLPALVNKLKVPGCNNCVVEFGTVLVFTCGQSCWSDTDGYRTETVLVQADPDQHLFNL